jgi:hypothetical protein
MRRAITLALVLASAMPAWAQGEDDEAADEEEGGDEGAEPADEEEEVVDDAAVLPPKQNLTGHDMTNKRPNEFERDRFFVDKVDTEKTENGTLIQGSIASSFFLYAERGSAYPDSTPADMAANTYGENAGPLRAFTELRLQTDFRHISGSRWDARIDARARVVNSGGNPGDGPGGAVTPENRIQSGLYGTSEYDVRELWLIRSGKRSDVFIGRQFIPDLGGLKIDGLRVDYAKSAKLTLIGFAGLFPQRGSRSVTTDYAPLESEAGTAAGRFVTAGGFGGAYRTVNAYGAIGAVVQYPLKLETPRLYVTSQGYMRSGSKLDFYHFALLDLLGSAASDSRAKVQLTNLSAGVNAKPSQRLRLTASVHHVDTETLNVQAGAFLTGVDMMGGTTVVNNEAYILRLATDTARVGVSAGLGKLQRFEVSTALSVRNRSQFTLVTPDPGAPDIVMPAARSIEVWGSIVDRRFFGETRVGLDVSRSLGIGDLAFQRSESLLGRLFVLRGFSNGRGEWETEASYTDVRDSVIGTSLNPMNGTCGLVPECYGTSNNKLFSLGGQLTYRLKTDWLGIATLHALRVTNTRSDGLVDPPVTGITGFLRIAKRF